MLDDKKDKGKEYIYDGCYVFGIILTLQRRLREELVEWVECRQKIR